MRPGVRAAASRVPAPLQRVLAVAVGLVCVGGGTAAAVAAGARAMPAVPFATLATWVTAANLLGLTFAVVDQYLPRLVLGARSRGEDDRPLVRTFSRGVAVAAAVLVTGVLLSGGWSVHALFAGRVDLLLLVAVYLLALALQSLQRGVAVGRQRFGLFPVQMGVDGLLRLTGALVLLPGGSSPTGYATVFCLAAWGGVLAGSCVLRGWCVWTGPGAAVAGGPLALLLLASLGPLAVNNAGVPWLTGSGAPARTVGAVAGALTLSRIPTLFVGAAFGPVLAPLVSAVEARDHVAFRRVHARALGLGTVLAGLFTAAFGVLGPVVLQTYLGPAYRLPRLELSAMAAGSGLMFLCVVEQAAVVSLAAWSRSAAGWVAGLVVFAGALAVPGDPASKVATAVVAGPLVALLVMALGGRATERSVFA